MDLYLTDLLEGIPFRCNAPELPRIRVHSLASDSRKVQDGTLFVAIPGTQMDGHAFIPQAFLQRALGVLVCQEEALQGEGLRILVQDTRKILARLALRLAGNPQNRLKLVGITGTNGKSTTAHLLAQLLEATKPAPVGLLGTLGGRVGARELPHALTTPEPITLAWHLAAMVDLGAEEAILEVSSHALVLNRVAELHFSVAILTNVSANEHLDFHGTFEAYRDAKRTLFDSAHSARAVLNADDPSYPLFLKTSGACRTYGIHSPAELRATEVSLGMSGTTLSLLHYGRRYGVESALLGQINVLNLLAALGAALELGRSLEDLLQAIPRLRPVPGRLEVIQCGQPFSVLVDYAHTPAALESLLSFAASTAPGKVHIVFGCGGDRDQGKRPLMGALAARYAARIFLTNDNPRTEDPKAILREIAQGVEDAGGSYQMIPDRVEAIEAALAQARPGDVVLLAGKGHEAFQEVGGESFPLDDRAVARAWLSQEHFGTEE